MQQNATERTEVILKCPDDVAGSAVLTWTRKHNGKMTVVGHHEKDEHQDQSRIHSSNETLVISDVQLGDSGLYYCNDEPAVYLTVIKGEQSEVRFQYIKSLLKRPTFFFPVQFCNQVITGMVNTEMFFHCHVTCHTLRVFSHLHFLLSNSGLFSPLVQFVWAGMNTVITLR